MSVQQALSGALPPIVAALLLVGFAGVRLLPLAMAVGLYVAHSLLKGLPAWPHELWAEPNGVQWLLWTVIAAALVATLEHLRVLGPKVGLVLGALVGGLGTWLVLQKVAARWDTTMVVANAGGGALAVVLSLVAARRVLARAPANVLPAAVWTLVLSIDAGLIALSGAALQGQLCGAVAAALGAAAGTGLWRRSFALTAADGTWLAIAHALALLAGVHLADLPLRAAGCALVAPALLLVLPASWGKQPARWFVSALVVVLVPLGIAAWLAWAGHVERSGGY